jgi:hypothetical protein
MTFEPPPNGRLVRYGIGGVARIHPSIEPSSDGRVDETARASGHADVSAPLPSASRPRLCRNQGAFTSALRM